MLARSRQLGVKGGGARVGGRAPRPSLAPAYCLLSESCRLLPLPTGMFCRAAMALTAYPRFWYLISPRKLRLEEVSSTISCTMGAASKKRRRQLLRVGVGAGGSPRRGTLTSRLMMGP